MTVDDDNHFTKKDVEAALKAYKDEFVTMPINSIVHFSGIAIEKNKRNHRDQKTHLARARAVQKIDYPNNEWAGRKSVQDDCMNFFELFPEADYKQFCETTGLKKSVYYKYRKIWKASYEGKGGFMKYRLEKNNRTLD